MPYTWSYTTPYNMLPTRYRASVLERCNDRMRRAAIINLSSMVGSGGTASTRVVFGGRHYLPGVGQVLDGVGCCNILGNNLLEVL